MTKISNQSQQQNSYPTVYQTNSTNNINTLYHPGFTVLHMAAAANDVERVRHYLQNGADWRIQTSDGRTALKIAEDYECPEAFALLTQVALDALNLN